MHQNYATALVAQIRSGQPIDAALSNLQQLLRQRDHVKLLPTILRVTLRAFEAGESSGPTVVVANATTWEQERAAITQALATLGTDDNPDIHTDETLIGGFIVTHNHRERDYSFKRALVNLFMSITK